MPDVLISQQRLTPSNMSRLEGLAPGNVNTRGRLLEQGPSRAQALREAVQQTQEPWSKGAPSGAELRVVLDFSRSSSLQPIPAERLARQADAASLSTLRTIGEQVAFSTRQSSAAPTAGQLETRTPFTAGAERPTRSGEGHNTVRMAVQQQIEARQGARSQPTAGARVETTAFSLRQSPEAPTAERRSERVFLIADSSLQARSGEGHNPVRTAAQQQVEARQGAESQSTAGARVETTAFSTRQSPEAPTAERRVGETFFSEGSSLRTTIAEQTARQAEPTSFATPRTMIGEQADFGTRQFPEASTTGLRKEGTSASADSSLQTRPEEWRDPVRTAAQQQIEARQAEVSQSVTQQRDEQTAFTTSQTLQTTTGEQHDKAAALSENSSPQATALDSQRYIQNNISDAQGPNGQYDDTTRSSVVLAEPNTETASFLAEPRSLAEPTEQPWLSDPRELISPHVDEGFNGRGGETSQNSVTRGEAEEFDELVKEIFPDHDSADSSSSPLVDLVLSGSGGGRKGGGDGSGGDGKGGGDGSGGDGKGEEENDDEEGKMLVLGVREEGEAIKKGALHDLWGNLGEQMPPWPEHPDEQIALLLREGYKMATKMEGALLEGKILARIQEVTLEALGDIHIEFAQQAGLDPKARETAKSRRAADPYGHGSFLELFIEHLLGAAPPHTSRDAAEAKRVKGRIGQPIDAAKLKPALEALREFLKSDLSKNVSGSDAKAIAEMVDRFVSSKELFALLDGFLMRRQLARDAQGTNKRHMELMAKEYYSLAQLSKKDTLAYGVAIAEHLRNSFRSMTTIAVSMRGQQVQVGISQRALEGQKRLAAMIALSGAWTQLVGIANSLSGASSSVAIAASRSVS